MNNTCCNPTMSVVGVRAAALGSRGLLFCQSQCKFVLGIKGSSLPHYARSVLPHPHRPTQKSSRLPSLLTVKCASHDPFPPATTFVLLNTKGINFCFNSLNKIHCFQVYGVRWLKYDPLPGFETFSLVLILVSTLTSVLCDRQDLAQMMQMWHRVSF